MMFDDFSYHVLHLCCSHHTWSASTQKASRTLCTKEFRTNLNTTNFAGRGEVRNSLLFQFIDSLKDNLRINGTFLNNR